MHWKIPRFAVRMESCLGPMANENRCGQQFWGIAGPFAYRSCTAAALPAGSAHLRPAPTNRLAVTAIRPVKGTGASPWRPRPRRRGRCGPSRVKGACELQGRQSGWSLYSMEFETAGVLP